MRALRRKTLYRPGPCKPALHKRRRLRLPNRLLILNTLILENDLMKDGQITKKKMLINPWVENFDRINSSQARKAWDDIAKQINLKFGTDNYLPLVRPLSKSFPSGYGFKAGKDENFSQVRPMPKQQKDIS